MRISPLACGSQRAADGIGALIPGEVAESKRARFSRGAEESPSASGWPAWLRCAFAAIRPLTSVAAAADMAAFRHIAGGCRLHGAHFMRSKVSSAALRRPGLSPVGRHDDRGFRLRQFRDLSRYLLLPPGFLSILGSHILISGEDVPGLGGSCRQQHRQDRGVGMADGVDADPADHGGHGPVGFCFDPGRPVFQPEMREARQQHATRSCAGAFR